MILRHFLAQVLLRSFATPRLHFCIGVAMSILLFVVAAHLVFWFMLRPCHSHWGGCVDVAHSCCRACSSMCFFAIQCLQIAKEWLPQGCNDEFLIP